MRESAINSSSFPAARCLVCGKTVLTYIGFDNVDEGQRFCIHCDSRIESDLTWITAEELSAEGYEIDSPSATRASGGCGASCGNCSIRGH